MLYSLRSVCPVQRIAQSVEGVKRQQSVAYPR